VKRALIPFAAVTVGFLLHVAGASKIFAPDDAIRWLSNIPVASRWPQGFLGLSVAAEFAIGWMLMLGVRQKTSAGAAMVMFACFGALLLAWPPDGAGCGCFGGLEQWIGTVSPVARNAGLAVAAYLLWRFSPEDVLATRGIIPCQ